MKKPDWILALAAKRVGVLGAGKEGQAVADFLRAQGCQQVEVFDDRAQGHRPLAESGECELLLRSPGVWPSAVRGGQLVGIAELFLRHCPSKHIIGVTGTKGKGTTCGILGAAARAARRRVHVCGNIGVPFFSIFADIQPDDLVVAELSSFQLWDAQTAPKVAVVLGISPDHLDMHADMTDYLNAKKNLVRGAGAGSQIIFCADSPSARAVAAAAGAGAKRIPFSARRRQMKSGAYLHQTANGQRYFALQEEGAAAPKLICAAAEGGLLGAGLGGPNTENTLAALAAGAAAGIPEVALAEGIRQFSGFAGRMEKLCTGQNGVSAWNDTAATTPEAAAGAVQTFSALEMPFLLICGGRAKVAGAGALAHQAAKSRWLRGVWCTGECGKTFAADMLAAGVSAHLVHEEQDMQTATKKACGAARPGHHVLLSPGAASFDAFPNATIRGQTFAHICAQELGADFALRKKV